MSVLVTGGAGFIGSHLIELLLARDPGTRVLCLDNFNDFYDPARKRSNVSAFLDNPRAAIVEQSFCDVAAVKRLLKAHRVRRVVHLGAYAGVRASLANPAVFAKTNVGGTLALLEAARAHPLERFVFASSSTVYGQGAGAPFDEDGPLGVPTSPYGVTKRAAELFCSAYGKLHGVPVVCIRPFSVYGPRIRPDLAMSVFAESIAGSRPIPLLGDGSHRRDFTHVSDVCRGLLAALEAPGIIGEAINLGHDAPVSIAELIVLLEEALGRKAVIDRCPASPADMPLTHASLTKARRLLGFEPSVALGDGVRDFVAWFRRHAP